MNGNDKTMPRYIDANKIDFNECFVGQSNFAINTRKAAQNLIDRQPSAEVEPVRHGHWVKDKYCSVCDFENKLFENFKYCPECGAKMDEKENKNANL